MGMRTVAVASEVDLDSAHAALAHTVVAMGEGRAASGYLDAEGLVSVAVAHGVTDLHPGFGFLAENADFARAVEAAGIRFVGPSPEAIEVMGSKIGARGILKDAGVSPVPGTAIDGADDPRLDDPALTYPLLVKASAGGGGKGMRRVDVAGDLPAAVDACRREAEASFGDGALLVERLVEDGRHVEVQVLGDRHGKVVALLERDCSVQRRHQKVLEECPAPGLRPETRQTLRRSALAVAAAVDYVGAGTVEFLVEPDGACHFLEMNTRLQVAHPVTELVVGVDLVEWQLRVAAGEAIPSEMEGVEPRGHAVEARLYAEDPTTGFLPSTGRLTTLRLPRGPGVRVDSGVREGDEVTADYDPMIAKVVAWGPDRPCALDRLGGALGEAHVVGVRSNLELLRWLVAHPEVRGGGASTAFLEARIADFAEVDERGPSEDEVLAAAVALVLGGGTSSRAPGARVPSIGAWEALPGWRL